MNQPSASSRFFFVLMVGGAAAGCNNPAPSDAGPQDVAHHNVQPDSATHGGRTGIVAITQQPAGDPDAGVGAANAVVGFTEGSFAMGTCSERMEGACAVRSCSPPPAGGGDSGVQAPALRSAGSVTISGGSGTPIVLMPDMDNVYPVAIQDTTRWIMGDMISVTAMGAMVPAFTSMITFPGNIRVTAPVPAMAGGPVIVPIGSDLRVTWEMGGASEVHVSLVQDAGDTGGALIIDCVFPGAAGSGLVPMAGLGDLASTTDGLPGTTLTIETRNLRPAMVTDWAINVIASQQSETHAVEVRE